MKLQHTSGAQRCGTCKWFECEDGKWGWCRYSIPPLPFPVPVYCDVSIEAGWRDLAADDREDCPTWHAK